MAGRELKKNTEISQILVDHGLQLLC